MDIALAIESLLPAAQYFGSVTDNLKHCFDDLDWQDSRAKPTWKQLQDAWVVLEPKLIAEAEAKIAAKQAILDRIGLTADELKTILG
jgi:hypothetical protein